MPCAIVACFGAARRIAASLRSLRAHALQWARQAEFSARKFLALCLQPCLQEESCSIERRWWIWIEQPSSRNVSTDELYRSTPKVMPLHSCLIDPDDCRI